MTQLQLTEKNYYNRRLTNLETERGPFFEDWRDVNEYIFTRRGRFTHTDRNRGSRRGRNSKIIDSTATFAQNILVSGMMSGMTSAARRWFRLQTPDPGLMEFKPVQIWLEDVEKLMYDIFVSGGLYQSLPNVYAEAAGYGTAAMMQLDDFDTVTRFETFTAGEYTLATNFKNNVDVFYRKVDMTVEQIVTKYLVQPDGSIDWSRVSPTVRQQWDKGNYDVWVPTVHLVEPNYPDKTFKDDDREAVDPDVFGYKSVAFEEHNSSTGFLKKRGFIDFPVYAPRWSLVPPDVYGSECPGFIALGDVKQLQDQHKKKGSALAKMVNPPMKGPTSMQGQRASTLPGDITFADEMQGGTAFEPAYQVRPMLSEFVADMEDVRQRIRHAYYADLFLMFTQEDRSNITAREIDAREAEKFLVLGPVFARMDTDLLTPLIDNTFNRMLRVGMLPPPPQELEGVELQIDFDNVMTRAQKAQGILGLQDLAAFVGNVSAFKPDAVDKFDADQAIDEFAQIRAAPAKVVVSDEQVEADRAARQQQMQQQMMAEQAADLSATAKNLGDTPTNQQNLLTDILGSAGAATAVV